MNMHCSNPRTYQSGCNEWSTTRSECNHWTWNGSEARQRLHFTLLGPVTRQQTFLRWYILIDSRLCNDLFCVEWDSIARFNSVVQRCAVIGHVSYEAAWLSFTGCLMATHVANKLVIMLPTFTAVLDPSWTFGIAYSSTSASVLFDLLTEVVPRYVG